MAKYKVKIDRNLCIECASCVAIAPDFFELDPEGKSMLKKKDGTVTLYPVTHEDIDKTNILNAARSCPVESISIIEVDDQGKEVKQVWPEV